MDGQHILSSDTPFTLTSDELFNQLAVETFPRSPHYDRSLLLNNVMGPNVLWLTDFLIQAMTVQPSMRLLDMGCGKVVSSIYPIHAEAHSLPFAGFF